jgi:two-component system sensor histidine kinase DegS
MSHATAPADPAERFAALEADTRRELEQTREQLNEIQLLLQQSANEADKLAQREAAITSRVRDMEINLENYSRSDIKTLYTTAHEVGLRLFMMRSQVEQLQMRQEHVKERQSHLGVILGLLTSMGGVLPQTQPALAPATPAPEAVAAATGLKTVIEAQESERLRVSRYLHDGPAQTLTNLVLKAEICEHLIDRDAAEAKAELQGLRGSLTTCLQETRRLIFNLRPMILDDIGLVATLRRYLTEMGRSAGFTHIVRGPENGDELTPPVRALLFRLVQDLVAGLAERSRLEQVAVEVNIQGTALELVVDVRTAADALLPAVDEVLALEPVTQRLYMLAATTEATSIGERGAQVIVQAALPAE